jgi:hypothetical protein
MTFKLSHLLSAVILALSVCVTPSAAQPGTLGDMRVRVHKENLDSFWLEQSMWQQYGFRPYVTLHVHQFGGRLANSAYPGFTFYGITMPAVSAKAINAESSKRRIQLARYGTWH